MNTSKGPAMSWDEWAKRDAVALAELVRTKQVTAQELAAQAAAAVEQLNPKIGAVLEIYENVLKDATVDGPNKDGRLFGVPMLGTMTAWVSVSRSVLRAMGITRTRPTPPTATPTTTAATTPTTVGRLSASISIADNNKADRL